MFYSISTVEYKPFLSNVYFYSDVQIYLHVTVTYKIDKIAQIFSKMKH